MMTWAWVEENEAAERNMIDRWLTTLGPDGDTGAAKLPLSLSGATKLAG
jgi:hypothetical protein